MVCHGEQTYLLEDESQELGAEAIQGPLVTCRRARAPRAESHLAATGREARRVVVGGLLHE